MRSARAFLASLALLPALLVAACAPAGPDAGPDPAAQPPAPSSPDRSPTRATSAPPAASPPSVRRTPTASTTTPTAARTPSSPRPSPTAASRARIGPGGSLMMTGTTAVGLTFDDGPYPEHTPQILDLLRENGVKATFCVLGRNAHTYPELIRRIHNEGHTFCNHSWRHDMQLRDRDEGAIRDDLSATINAIREAVPSAKVPYFRTPGGSFDSRLIRIAGSMGMTSIYWHVDTRDWEISKYGRGQTMVNQIVSNVQQNTRPGSIVLSHDTLKPDTLAAYRTLLPWLKARFTLAALPANGQLAPS